MKLYNWLRNYVNMHLHNTSRKLIRFLFNRLSYKTMRRIYVGSLCGLLTQYTEIACKDLEKINEELKVTEDARYLKFYSWLHVFVWSKDILYKPIDFGDRELKLKDVNFSHLTDYEIIVLSQWLIDELDSTFTDFISKDHLGKDLPDDTQKIFHRI